MEVPLSEPPSRKLARFAAGLRLADVPAAVRDRAKLHILDGLGLGLASNAYDYGRRAVAGVAAMGATAAAPCWAARSGLRCGTRHSSTAF